MTVSIIFLAYVAICLFAGVRLVEKGHGGWAILPFLMLFFTSFKFTDG
jgi:hypothetical protein